MNEEKQKILNFAIDYFLNNGFYKTTMDEIASNLKVSKKTIYKHFPSKDVLLKNATFSFVLKMRTEIEKILNQERDAVTKFYNFAEMIGSSIMKINPKFLDDIRIYKPELWNELDDFRSKVMLANIGKIIEQGKREGYFVDEPTEILLAIFISSIRGVVNPEFIMNNKFSAKEALQHTIKFLLNGMMTDKAKRIFKNIKSGAANEND